LSTIELLPSQVDTILAGNWKQGTVPELWDGNTGPRIIDEVEKFLAQRKT
jgi:UDP-N-acetylglucosamine 2-epimerase (non-hydrolysing)